MASGRKEVEAADLCWIFTKRVRDSGNFPFGFAVAIVADDDLGWRAVVRVQNRSLVTPTRRRQLSRIEDELRGSYALAQN